MSVHGPISSDIAAQANVGVQGNNGSRRRKRQTTLVTHLGHYRLNRHAAPPTINSAQNQIKAGRILWPKRGSNDGWQQSWRPM
jgi:hypothetical protein